MLFGAGIRRGLGEVEGAGGMLLRPRIRVHALQGRAGREVGLAIVLRGPAGYQMMPVSLPAAEARRLVALIESTVQTH